MNAPLPLREARRGGSLSARVSEALSRRSGGQRPFIDDGARLLHLDALAARTWIDAPYGQLAGRNLLIVTDRPLSAALAICSVDGVAARMVICPPDLDFGRLSEIIAAAEIDAIVHDGGRIDALPGGVATHAIVAEPNGAGPALPADGRATQWGLFTSGTTGAPKIAVHDLAGLTDAISPDSSASDPLVWATFYDTRRFGGLQMLLRALTGAATMMMTSPYEPMDDFIARLATAGVTHLAGTPSHWRSALRRRALASLTPRYVRLSGEIADQTLLDRLARLFPAAAVGHAYASTEAGVGFEVNDGLEGFPADYLTREGPVQLRLRDGSLQLRSARTAHAYLGGDPGPVADPEGFVDSGDLIERRGDRLYFMGRATGVINVGGLKVHPEEVEAVINRYPGVQMSLVKGRRSSITGALVTAEVVLDDPPANTEAARVLQQAITESCRSVLAAHKVPAALKFVDQLPLTAGGKTARRDA